MLEKFEAHQEQRNRDLADRDSDLAERLGELSEQLARLTSAVEAIVTQRAMESKTADRWKTAAMTFSIAVALGLLAWVGRIAMIVQTARAGG